MNSDFQQGEWGEMWFYFLIENIHFFFRMDRLNFKMISISICVYLYGIIL